MKATLKHLFIFGLVIFSLLLGACNDNDENPDDNTGPEDMPSLTDLVGRWGITQTEDGQGNTTTSAPCKKTLEVWSSGNFLIVDATQGEWLEGTVAFDEADSSVTLTAGSTTLDLKLLSIDASGLVLQEEDSDNGTIQINTQQFVLLEESDCASFTAESLTHKWSISEFSQEQFENGQLVREESMDEIPQNLFTIEFRTDGTALTFDFINEYNYNQGVFRMLDNHNLVLDFDFEDDDPGTLVHLESVQWPYWIMESVERDFDGSAGLEELNVSTFTISQNGEEVPTIGSEALQGKWSANQVSEKFYGADQLMDEHAIDKIDHNKFTLEFTSDGHYNWVDLVRSVSVIQGTYEMLDGSNVLLNLSDHHTGSDDPKDCPDHILFHLNFNEADQSIGLIRYSGVSEEDQREGIDLETFELNMAKNSGNEPGISLEELQDDWQILEVENLSQSGQNNPDEGPQLGMIIQFASEGTGSVSMQGQTVTSLEYNMVDNSNLLVSFDDGDNEEDSNFSIFHIQEQSADRIEFIIFEPRRGNEAGELGGAQFSVIVQKL